MLHLQGETIQAAQYLLKKYGLNHHNFKEFAFREKAKLEFILMTVEGILGQKQMVRIPKNALEFPLV